MAEKGFFFNAMPDEAYETGYDRNYSADDISSWLEVAFTTGVVKTNNEAGTGNPLGLKVVASSGLTINVNAGFACIDGKPYKNDSLLSFTLDTAPTGSNPRYDCVILRMDNTQTKSARRTYVYIKEVNAIPTTSDLTRTDEVYELLLAYVKVEPNETTIQQADITDKRGDEDFCPWFTAVKGYEDYYDAIVQEFNYRQVLSSAGRLVTTTLATSLYNNRYSLIEVYCNGLKEIEGTDYSVIASGAFIQISFTANKSSGAEILVVLENFIDGEGLSTAIDDYNNWVQDVANLQTANEHTYVCNGLNDNVLITNIVNNFIAGGTDYGSMLLKIVGNFGCLNGGSYPVTVGGSGTSASPYRIFSFNEGNRKVILDFSDCGQVSVPISGVCAVIFYGKNVTIKGLNLVSNSSSNGTSVKAFNAVSGNIICEDCRFYITGYTESLISYTGTFTNCRGSVRNVSGNSYCFLASGSGLVRLNGGEYYAYTGDQSARSAITGQSATNAVCILYAVNAPTNDLSASGWYQYNSVLQLNNDNWVCCTDLISALPLSVVSGRSSIRGTIALSKKDQM